jgi:Ca-activated chloride channel homolog
MPDAEHCRSPFSAMTLTITSAFLLCLMSPAAASASSTMRPQATTLDLSEARSGELLWKSVEGLVPLPVLDLEVRLEVTGVLVHGSVTQTFRNLLPETIECLYVFPLPERAAVHRLELRIGERRIVAVVQEREQARKIYQQARQEGRKGTLLEQDRPNLFTVSVANVNADESVHVRLEYLQELIYDDGEFSLAVPLTFMPRFFPGPGPGTCKGVMPQLRTGPGDDRGVPRAKIEARIEAGIDLAEVASASHAIRTWRDGEALEVELQDGRVPADRDFLLSWRAAPSKTPRSVLFAEEREDGRYLLMMLLPPLDETGPATALPTETVFVVDVSGSMDGPSIVQAREALLAALDRLRPGDRFAILAFNDRVLPFLPAFVPAAGPALAEAKMWVGSLEATGGTMIGPALRQALDMIDADDGDRDRVPRVVLLTDGAVGNEDEVVRSIRAHPGRVRLHALGIGSAPNRYLMRKMAEAGRGLWGFISTTDGLSNRIDAFLARLDSPVLADLRLEWEGAPPEAIHPAVLPDLHAGETLWLSARQVPGAPLGRPVLVGRGPLGTLRLPIEVAAPSPEGSGVAVRWARAGIESLLDALQEGADPAAIRAEVVTLSKEFGIASPFTSLVAVEDFPTATGEARTVKVPSSLPVGSTLDGSLPQGGTDDALRFLVGILLMIAGGALMTCDRLLADRRPATTSR